MTERRRATAPAHGPAPAVSGNVQDGNIRVALARLSKAAKMSVEHVTETWSERAAIREYLGGFSRNVAESRGLADAARTLGRPAT